VYRAVLVTPASLRVARGRPRNWRGNAVSREGVRWPGRSVASLSVGPDWGRGWDMCPGLAPPLAVDALQRGSRTVRSSLCKAEMSFIARLNPRCQSVCPLLRA
jgi:hypothetical protein